MPLLELFKNRGCSKCNSVIALLNEMSIPYKITHVDHMMGDRFKEEQVKMNPQRQGPVIKYGDFFLSESNAILQYLCDKYGENHPTLYPKNPEQRGIVNNRLTYNVANFFPRVSEFVYGAKMARDQPIELKKELTSKALVTLNVVETMLKNQGTKFAAGDSFTIADIAMMATATCLETVKFDFSPFPCIAKWFETCKVQHPTVWNDFKVYKDELYSFVVNPVSMEKIAKFEKLKEESFKISPSLIAC